MTAQPSVARLEDAIFKLVVVDVAQRSGQAAIDQGRAVIDVAGVVAGVIQCQRQAQAGAEAGQQRGVELVFNRALSLHGAVGMSARVVQPPGQRVRLERAARA